MLGLFPVKDGSWGFVNECQASTLPNEVQPVKTSPVCLICSLMVTKPVRPLAYWLDMEKVSDAQYLSAKTVLCFPQRTMKTALPLIVRCWSVCVCLFQSLLLVRYRGEECGTRKENFVVELETGLGLFLKS